MKPVTTQTIRKASVPALNVIIRLMDIFAVATCGYWTHHALGGADHRTPNGLNEAPALMSVEATSAAARQQPDNPSNPLVAGNEQPASS